MGACRITGMGGKTIRSRDVSRWGLGIALLMLSGCGTGEEFLLGECPGCAASPAGEIGGRTDDPVDGPRAFTAEAANETQGEDTDPDGPPPGETPINGQPVSDDESTEEPSTEDPDAPPPDDPAPSDSPIHDPFVFDPTFFNTVALDPLVGPALSEPNYFDDLLSLAVDDLVLDLIGPLSSADSFTHLELLCRDLGLPEHYCRQRYGY